MLKELYILLTSRKVKNSFSILVEKAFALGIAFFVGIYVARYLGPNNYGLWSFSLSFCSLFLPISSLGLDLIAVKELSVRKYHDLRIVWTTFNLKLVASLVSFLISFTISIIFFEFETFKIVLIVSIGYFFYSFNVFDFYFQARLKSFYTTVSKNISKLASSGFKVILIAGSANVLWFGVSVIIETIFSAILSFIFFFNYIGFRRLKGLKFRKDYYLKGKLLRTSAPLLLTGISTTIDLKIDQIIIKAVLNESDLGNYAAASRLSELWYFIPVAITISYLPSISKKIKSGDDFSYEIKNLSAILFYIALFVALLVSFFSDKLVNILYGLEFNKTASILCIHIWASCFVFLGQVSSKLMVARNLQNQLFKVRLVSSLINILLNFMLIPSLGVIGAAYATLVSYSIANLFGYLFLNETRGIILLQLRGVLRIR